MYTKRVQIFNLVGDGARFALLSGEHTASLLANTRRCT